MNRSLKIIVLIIITISIFIIGRLSVNYNHIGYIYTYSEYDCYEHLCKLKYIKQLLKYYKLFFYIIKIEKIYFYNNIINI